ncbi:MAG TPA: hypothetical protein VND93_30130, partial [Myxococcales bacterium]|nr:hypothetical protein [Myxococcales bacterium]
MAHRWSFFRAGGFDQVRLDTGADYAALAELDPKLWVALSCPTTGVEIDPHSLELLDTDKDGRVRVPEVLAAVKWMTGVLKSPDLIAAAPARLPLEAINDSTEEGRRLLASARQILHHLGRGSEASIAPADTADTVKITARMLLNGDGVLPPESAGDDAAAAGALKEIMGALGTAKDMSGLDGADAPRIKQFFTEARALVDWWKGSQGDATVLPLGDATLPAWEALQAVRGKVDDFFTRCALAEMMGAQVAASLNPPEAEWVALAREELSGGHQRLASLPLARIEVGAALPLAGKVNPAWSERVERFRAACVVPLAGEKSALSLADWTQLKERLAAHGAWLATRPKTAIDQVGLPRLRELVEGPVQATLEALLEKEKALEPEVKAVTSVDRLAHLVRDLKPLLDNFVSFKDFYSRQRKAAFQAGTLYLDSRSMDLCLRVDDVGKHSALAAQSMAYLAYCECRRSSGETMNVVAALTGGDSDFLSVGRNGVFFDRRGRDWDATVVKLVDAPIGIRQAFFAPYKRLARFVTEQVEKFAASRGKEQDAALAQGVAQAGAEKPAAFDVAKFAGIFAAVGLAVGAIGTALATMAAGLWALRWWQMPVAVAAALLVVSSPSMLLAGMKLRLRNLAPLLDACGWAINSRVLISIPFGATLTQLAVLPPGSTRSLTDPYAPRPARWPWVLLAVAALASAGWWLHRTGLLAAWFPSLFPRP